MTELVGKRITVWWEEDETWYKGQIVDFDPVGEHYVVYDDAGEASAIGGGHSAGLASSTDIEHARTHPKHLHSIATSHPWALGAIAELLDNAYDEIGKGCTSVRLDVESIDIARIGNGGAGEVASALVVSDDGGGLDRVGVHRMLSLGMCSKVGSRLIGQYGNGFKTSTTRLGGSALVLTRCAGEMACGLLSYRYLIEEGLDDVIVPLVGWDHSGRAIGVATAAERQKRQASLAALAKWTPYKDEAALLDALRERCGARGTTVLIYHLWQTADGTGTSELDFGDKHDIRTRQIDAAHQPMRNPHRRGANEMVEGYAAGDYKYFSAFTSLRKYAAILYRDRGRSFNIILRGKAVAPLDVTASLRHKASFTYAPVGLPAGCAGTYNVTVGFVPEAPDSRVMGIYVYHRKRLIKPLWVPWRTTNSEGRGLIGTVEVDFLEPKHDKQDFAESNGALSKLQAKLSSLMRSHWREHCEEVGWRGGHSNSSKVKRAAHRKRKAREMDGGDDDEEDEEDEDEDEEEKEEHDEHDEVVYDDDEYAEEVDDHNLDWTNLEVCSDMFDETFAPFARIVGTDVCVLRAAFPDFPVADEGTVGWRGEVMARRLHSGRQQVSIFGAWLELQDASRVRPIQQEVQDVRVAEVEAEEVEAQAEDGGAGVLAAAEHAKVVQQLRAALEEVERLRASQGELRELQRWKESATRMLAASGITLAFPLPPAVL